MSRGRPHEADESDLTPAYRELIAQLARWARERRSRAATDAELAHGARKTHER